LALKIVGPDRAAATAPPPGGAQKGAGRLNCELRAPGHFSFFDARGPPRSQPGRINWVCPPPAAWRNPWSALAPSRPQAPSTDWAPAGAPPTSPPCARPPNGLGPVTRAPPETAPVVGPGLFEGRGPRHPTPGRQKPGSRPAPPPESPPRRFRARFFFSPSAVRSRPPVPIPPWAGAPNAVPFLPLPWLPGTAARGPPLLPEPKTNPDRLRCPLPREHRMKLFNPGCPPPAIQMEKNQRVFRTHPTQKISTAIRLEPSCPLGLEARKAGRGYP